MEYNVYIIPYGNTASNCGIIASEPAKRSKWAVDGKLIWESWNDGRVNYQFNAPDDTTAYQTLTKLHGHRKPIAGKSYIRHCRPQLRKR